MVTQIINADPTAIKEVRVDRAQLSSTLMRPMAIGAVLPVLVREGAQGDKGLISVGGQLIPAKLPGNLQAGDRLVAQVLDGGQQLIFKILDIKRPALPTPGGPSVVLTRQLETLVKDGVLDKLTSLKSFSLPENVPGLPAQLQTLFPQIEGPEHFQVASAALRQLQSALQGEFTATFEQALKMIKTLSQSTSLPQSSRLTSALIENLSQLFDRPLGEQEAHKSLTRIIETLTKAIKDNKVESPEKESLKKVLSELKQLSASAQDLKSAIGTILKQAELQTTQNPVRSEQITQQKLQAAINQLEQMTQLHSTLQQLNPLMHSLGEPALILFPFLAQGLLSHGEVSIDPDAHKKQQQESGENASGEQNTESDKPYQRVSIHVPLPNIGEVFVEVAHRDQEILVTLITPDDQVASFINDKFVELEALFRSQGFTKAEFTTRVGEPPHLLPPWVEGLHGSTSVIA